MTAVLAILGSLVQQGLSFAKFILGLTKVALLKIALSARFAIVYIGHFIGRQAIFYAAIYAAFEACVVGLSFFLLTPLTSSLLRSLLPDGNEWAQGLYYLAWEEGLSLSTAWSLLLVYWGNVFAAHRVLDVLAQALSFRILVWDGEKQISMGLLAGRGS